MRYIAIFKHGFYLTQQRDIYTIEKDTGHDYLMNVRTHRISFTGAKIMPSGIYYDRGYYIIPETDPWFNYFIFKQQLIHSLREMDVAGDISISYKLVQALSKHLQKLI